jgi:hypothetical protein
MADRERLVGIGTGNAPGSREALDAHRRPEAARLSHQAERFLGRAIAPSCDHCLANETCEAFRPGGTCLLAEARQAEVLDAVMAEAQITPALEPLALEYAKTATAVQIIDTYLAHGSPFLPGAPAYIEPQPVMTMRTKLSSRMQSLAAELGLTPAAKARLARDGEQNAAMTELARAMAQIKGQADPAAPPVDGDFEAEEGQGGEAPA